MPNSTNDKQQDHTPDKAQDKTSDSGKIRQILLGDLEETLNKRLESLDARIKTLETVALEKSLPAQGGDAAVTRQDLIDLQHSMQAYLIKVLEENAKGGEDLSDAFVAFGQYLKKKSFFEMKKA